MIRTGKARHARHGKAGGGHGPLTLIPMIDMLMILVVYLLVHSADTEILPNTRNISIPQSVSERKPSPSTVVTVTRDMLYVNGEAVVSVTEVARLRTRRSSTPCRRRSPRRRRRGSAMPPRRARSR